MTPHTNGTIQPPTIETSRLRKSNGDRTVLDGIDLQVQPGTIYALLGPNGAGKTTLIHILSTLLKPDAAARTWPGGTCSPTLAGIDRPLLERYLAWLSTQPAGHGAKEDAVTGVHLLFTAIRQHGWDDTLPTTAVFFAGDTPRRPPRRSRRLSEHVMAQIEAPANLDRWAHPDARLITLILIRCGLRASDACTLAFDCLLHDGQGAPYLRYINQQDAPRGRPPHRRRARG